MLKWSQLIVLIGCVNVFNMLAPFWRDEHSRVFVKVNVHEMKKSLLPFQSLMRMVK